ncbi:MAG TPA: DUF6801 domain-containing protein [Pseudonocardiaceae bacterium]|nr:DUF6801 domain-containing protein [Pseudonocardiaceae bacterium]
MAVIGTVIIVTGILTGTGSAIGQQNAHRHFTYSCLFPSGTQQVDVDITAAFPSSGTVGQAVAPANGTVTVAIPHAGLRSLTALHAATVGSITQLHTTIGQNGRSENASWTNLVAAPKPIPATGDLVLTASTKAPTITPRAAGDITFGAGTIVMLLSPKQANGLPTAQATIAVGCAPQAGQHVRFATVPVPSATVSASRELKGALTIQQPRSARSSVIAQDDGPTTTPADCGIIPPDYPDDSLGLGLCGFLTGLVNVNKLDQATPIAPNGALFNAFGPYEVAITCEPDFEPTVQDCQAQPPERHDLLHAFQCSFAQFENNGHQLELPPTKATFVAFGFEPVTATMNLSEAPWPADSPPTPAAVCGTGIFSQFVFGPPPPPLPNPAVLVTSDSVNNLSPDGVFTTTLNTTLETYLDVRISDATVNGVPLTVGNHCHTSQPVHSLTTASGGVDQDGNPFGYSFVSGGPVLGTIDIPSFTGCGVGGDDLDPLFDSAVSSNNDFLHLTQGPLCTPSTTIGCPPTVPETQR